MLAERFVKAQDEELRHSNSTVVNNKRDIRIDFIVTTSTAKTALKVRFVGLSQGVIKEFDYRTIVSFFLFTG